MPLKGVRYTLLSERESKGVARFAGGTLELTTTMYTGVVQTLPTGESRKMLVYGYAESVIHMAVSPTRVTTLH